jgi:hypothetical protein
MFAATSPASAAAPAVAPWQHLDIPHRMARVISTARLNFGEDRVTERDFARAVETCDLSKDELEANLGAAARLLISEEPEPTYSRAERVAHGAAAILGMLPSRADLEGRLALYHFPKSEIADLWRRDRRQSGRRLSRPGRATPVSRRPRPMGPRHARDERRVRRRSSTPKSALDRTLGASDARAERGRDCRPAPKLGTRRGWRSRPPDRPGAAGS